MDRITQRAWAGPRNLLHYPPNTQTHKLTASLLTFQLDHFHSFPLLILAYELQTLLLKVLFQFWIDLEDQK